MQILLQQHVPSLRITVCYHEVLSMIWAFIKLHRQPMETLSFSQFRRYCDGRAIKRIIYETENNKRIKDAEKR